MVFPKPERTISGVHVTVSPPDTWRWEVDGQRWRYQGKALFRDGADGTGPQVSLCEDLKEAVGFARGWTEAQPHPPKPAPAPSAPAPRPKPVPKPAPPPAPPAEE